MLDGVFILRVLRRDDQGRPTEAVGLRPVTALGEPLLVRCELDIAWDEDVPRRSWRPLSNDWYQPAD